MGKREFGRKSYIVEMDEQEKETYLKELENSVHNYIKTGVKNRQLEDLIELEEEFNQKYNERFDTKKIAEQISEYSKNFMIDFVKEYVKINDNRKISRDLVYSLPSDESSDKFYHIMVETISYKLNEAINDAAYLSHMNMLYELYEKEEQLRREKDEYDRISEKYQQMADIMKTLSEQRRIELKQLQEQTGISKLALEYILTQNPKYFNIRQKSEDIQVSLSPSGKKYYNHVMDSQETFSGETFHQTIYKNCDNLMEALENSYERGIEYKLKLEKLPPEKERALQSRYHTIAQKFISDHEDMYYPKIINMVDEKESRFHNYEKNKYRIPVDWDSGIN